MESNGSFSDGETQNLKPWLFVLEDTDRRIDLMTAAVGRTWKPEVWELASDATAAISRLEKDYSSFKVISLDHDLFAREPGIDPGVGMDVVLWLERQPPTARVIIHSANGPAGSEMFNRLARKGFLVKRVFPSADDRWVDEDWLPEVKRLKDW